MSRSRGVCCQAGGAEELFQALGFYVIDPPPPTHTHTHTSKQTEDEEKLSVASDAQHSSSGSSVS